MSSEQWIELYSGVWRRRVGEGSSLRPLDVTRAAAREGALAELPTAPFPFARGAATADPRGGCTVLRFPLRSDEHVYGFGLQFRRIDQRGTVKRLQVDHYGREDAGPTHASLPLYFSSDGYGVLVNTSRVVTAYIGTAVRVDAANPPTVRDRNTDPEWSAQPLSDAVELLVPEPSIDVIVFAGPTTLDAVRRYNLLCGGGCLPPKWGLGFWHRVPTLYTDEATVAEVDEFAARGVPIDVVGLEPGWHSRSYPCTYEWDATRFPDPAAFIDKMSERRVHVNLWENPYVSPESALHDALLPLSGSHTVWCGIVPDLTLPEAQELIGSQHVREHLDIGVSGYKLDECDGHDAWLWPLHAEFPSGLTGEEMRQLYGLQWQAMLAERFRRRDRRTYGLVRGSYVGASPLPFVLYSDCYDHRDYITALCNSGFGGVLWTPEVRGAGSDEEWIRRVQSVCFSPMAMLNAWASGTKPWTFETVADAVREAILLRMRLLPYLYTAFAEYCFHGTPPFRAMPLERGTSDVSSDAIIDARDQYMMGPSILVAPLFAGQSSREVRFPSDRWYDFYTGKLVSDGGVATISAPLDQIPLFVRDGGIVPMMEASTHVPMPDEPMELEVRHYGRSASSYALYDDDGLSFAYERGEHAWIELAASRGASGLTGSSAIRFAGRETSYRAFLWRFMSGSAS